MTAATISRRRSTNRSSENAAEWRSSVSPLQVSRRHAPIAAAIDAGTGSSKKTPVVPSTTVSRNPPHRSAAVGFPNAAASSGVNPKSSYDAATTATQEA